MTNWNTFDLNLLVVFDAVMQEKNLTRTGQRLGLTQSAVSHALARLRHMLKDELFVRTPEGMLPTPRAERMFGPIHQALQEMRVVLEADEFDPTEASRTFTISANNYAARAVIPAFVRRVAVLAPSVVVEVRPTGMLHTLDQLDAGAVELALEALTAGGERFKCVGLLEDDYVLILSSDHPAASEPCCRSSISGACPTSPSPPAATIRSSWMTHSPSMAWRATSGQGSRCIPCCRFLSDPGHWQSCHGASPRTS